MYLEKMLRRGGDGGGDSFFGAAASTDSQPAARSRPNRGDSACATARSAGPMPLAVASFAAGAVMPPSPEGSSLEPLERRSADNSSSADAHKRKAQISFAAQQVPHTNLHAHQSVCTPQHLRAGPSGLRQGRCCCGGCGGGRGWARAVTAGCAGWAPLQGAAARLWRLRVLSLLPSPLMQQ